MMHDNGLIVCLLNSTNKAIRELNHSKSGGVSTVNVVMPFDEEYKIKFKNLSQKRRRLEIDIDGTEISKDLILGANQEFKLERFLNSDKRFKFVMENNTAVSDPTNSDNGIIHIRAYDENSSTADFLLDEIKRAIKEVKRNPYIPQYPYTPQYPYIPQYPYTPQYPYISWEHPTKGSNSTILHSMAPNDSQKCHFNTVVDQYSNVKTQERGATIEGSKSDQKFSSTTWNGDTGRALEFIFQLKGETLNYVEALYCTACGKKFRIKDRFCAGCGNPR